METLSVKDRVQLVLDTVQKMYDGGIGALQNSKSFYDADLIQVEFGMSHNVARAVAKILTRGLKN